MSQNNDLRTGLSLVSPTRRMAAFAGAAALTCALATGTFGLAPLAHADEPSAEPVASATEEQLRTITVNGTDSVSVEPDVAELSLGISIDGTDAAACQTQAAQTLDAVTAALVGAGVPEDAITTSNVNLYPQYDYSTGVEAIVGYQMNVGISVEGLSIDQVGTIVSVATGAGANVVNSVTYYSSDYDAQYLQALTQAIEQARAKAEAIAALDGSTLGAALSVEEGYDGQQYRLTSSMAYATDEAATADSGGSAASALGIDPGTIDIEASVTVQYQVVSAS